MSSSGARGGKKPRAGRRPSSRPAPPVPPDSGSLFDFLGTLASGVWRAAGSPLKVAEALLLTPDQMKVLGPRQRAAMREAGLYLRDVREVTGLTVDDLGAALNLREHSLLSAVESGTATLSFELILRLAALLARHDPIPFVMRLTRAYNPDLWKLLQAWGMAGLPLQFERERQFVNIYRGRDAARKLTDEGFAALLAFTEAAFEMALHFAIEHQRSGRRGRE